MDDLFQRWKYEYEGEVYRATVGGTDYIFRALTLSEMEQIEILAGEGGSGDVEDLYVQAAVLSPENLNVDKLKAGYVTRLAEEIKQFSGAGDVSFIFENLIQQRDSIALDVTRMMKAFIITAMPTSTEEGLQELTLKQLIAKVVLAEQIMNFQQSMMGVAVPDVRFMLQIVDENAPVEQETPIMKDGFIRSTKKKSNLPADVTREQLLKKIRGDVEVDDMNSLRGIDQSALKNFDTDLLVKASGDYVAPDDPVARKLRQAMAAMG